MNYHMGTWVAFHRLGWLRAVAKLHDPQDELHVLALMEKLRILRTTELEVSPQDHADIERLLGEAEYPSGFNRSLIPSVQRKIQNVDVEYMGYSWVWKWYKDNENKTTKTIMVHKSGSQECMSVRFRVDQNRLEYQATGSIWPQSREMEIHPTNPDIIPEGFMDVLHGESFHVEVVNEAMLLLKYFRAYHEFGQEWPAGTM